MSLRLRPARPIDADAIAAVHVAAWRAAYDGLVPDELLARRDLDDRRRTWSRALSAAEPTGEVTVAEDERGLAGFAMVGPARDDDAGPDTGELYVLYVAPERWGEGTGRTLLAAALDQLRAAGFDGATLWVLSINERARRFYEAAGWIADAQSRGSDERCGAAETRYRIGLR